MYIGWREYNFCIVVKTIVLLFIYELTCLISYCWSVWIIFSIMLNCYLQSFIGWSCKLKCFVLWILAVIFKLKNCVFSWLLNCLVGLTQNTFLGRLICCMYTCLVVCICCELSIYSILWFTSGLYHLIYTSKQFVYAIIILCVGKADLFFWNFYSNLIGHR